MNRTLRYALVAAMSTAMVLPALAQDNFPDTPDNHWAYEALKNMKKDGLLVGYPDGLFRGGRPASRYEMAVAIHATYQRLKGVTDGLDSQIKAMTASLDGKADKADLQAIRDALEALKADVAGMKAWGDDIANLKKLTATFEKEIASLGVDVEAMKKDLGDLKDRVKALEGRKPAVDIHGTVDLVALAGYSTSDRFGLTVDGRQVGVGRDDYDFDPVGINRDLTILHEGALTFSGTNTEGPKWHATLVVGNMLGDEGPLDDSWFGPFGNQAWPISESAFAEGYETVYFQDFVVSFDTSLLGQNFNAEVGRVAYKVSPFMFQRPDTTPYFSNDRWDSGKWMFDGGILNFNVGSAKLAVFGGRKSGQVASGTTSSDLRLQPMDVGQQGSPWDSEFRPIGLWNDNALYMQIDQMLGLHLTTPITSKAELNLAYLWLDSNSVDTIIVGNVSESYNRLAVYGGDVKFNFDPFTLAAGYSVSDLQYNQHNVISDENYAWFAHLGYKADKWGLEACYKEIRPQYAAPGDWGRIGVWWNPTDIKGFAAKGNLALSDALSLKASGEFYTGIDDDVSSWGVDQKVNRYTANLGYKLNANWDVDLGWEYVQYNLESGESKPTETWFNIGLNYALGANAKLKFLWQMSDYNSKDWYELDIDESSRFTGGLITTQLSVKF